MESDAFGNAVPLSDDYYLSGFPGQSRIFSDLYYNRYRDYDPVTGRYIQADPIGLAGGSNPYAYVLNNPVNMIDPDGLFAQAAVARAHPGFLVIYGVGLTLSAINTQNESRQICLPIAARRPADRMQFRRYTGLSDHDLLEDKCDTQEQIDELDCLD